MDKETVKNRKTTEQNLLNAVNEIIEESGFENIGVNAVAAKAGVSKMLIYRYFESLDGLIAAYIRQHDYRINFNPELPDLEHLSDFVKGMFKQQITSLRENYALRRLYRWELTKRNAFTKDLCAKREAKGVWLIETVSRLTGGSQKEITFLVTLLSTSISYPTLLEESYPVYNGIEIQQDSSWQELEEGINSLIDRWLSDL